MSVVQVSVDSSSEDAEDAEELEVSCACHDQRGADGSEAYARLYELLVDLPVGLALGAEALEALEILHEDLRCSLLRRASVAESEGQAAACDDVGMHMPEGLNVVDPCVLPCPAVLFSSLLHVIQLGVRPLDDIGDLRLEEGGGGGDLVPEHEVPCQDAKQDQVRPNFLQHEVGRGDFEPRSNGPAVGLEEHEAQRERRPGGRHVQVHVLPLLDPAAQRRVAPVAHCLRRVRRPPPRDVLPQHILQLEIS
mmetsp:Transcript_13560/g.47136  ORF Transcript_13560/g.47136 Transcript_13560/m.47136 type:complete len:250 (-) Transcript_13560:395-1144(-)